MTIYLATPYSDSDPAVMLHRFNVVTEVSAKLMMQGKFVFSPITHSHPIAQYMDAEKRVSWEYWERFDTEFMSWCREVYVLMLPGWKESVGVQAEIKLANRLGKHITYINERLEPLMIDNSRVEEISG